MVDEVALERIEVGVKAALVLHDALQFADNPVGEPQPLDDFRLRLLFGRHLLERNLCPDRFPDGGVGLVHRPEVEQIQIALGREVVVALVAMLIQEALREGS